MPADVTEPPRPRSAHLICGSALRGVAVTAACAYFAYRSYAVLRDQDFPWQHELWAVVTWVVWIVLLAGLFFETRCRRERVLMLLLLANCLLGLIGSAWAFENARWTRELSLALWFIAALVGLSTIRIGHSRNGRPAK